MNVVLVHGAWADGSSWSAVIRVLQGHGIRVLLIGRDVCAFPDRSDLPR